MLKQGTTKKLSSVLFTCTASSAVSLSLSEIVAGARLEGGTDCVGGGGGLGQAQDHVGGPVRRAEWGHG